MIKKILKLLKKIIVAGLLIYGYNLIAAPLNLLIPINIITIGVVTFLGAPSLLALVMILIIAY